MLFQKSFSGYSKSKGLTYTQKINTFIAEWERLYLKVCDQQQALFKALADDSTKKLKYPGAFESLSGYIKVLPQRIKNEGYIMSGDFAPRFIEPRIYFLKQLKEDLEQMFPDKKIIRECRDHCAALIEELKNINKPEFVSSYYKSRNESEKKEKIPTIVKDSAPSDPPVNNTTLVKLS